MNKHLVACHMYMYRRLYLLHVHVCHQAKVGRESRRQRERQAVHTAHVNVSGSIRSYTAQCTILYQTLT